MSTQSRDLVAVGFPGLSVDEVGLKQVATMFNRIALSGVSLIPPGTFEDPEFVTRRRWLLETGLLFDPDPKTFGPDSPEDRMRAFDVLRDDADAVLKPSGLSLEEAMAARKDEAKAAEIKKKSAQLDPSAFASMDPAKFMESAQRLSANVMRIVTAQLRKSNLDAYTVLASHFSSMDQHDESASSHDVVKIVLHALPVPAAHVPWEQIIDYRNDPESQKQFLQVKDCICEIARGNVAAMYAEETLRYLLNRHGQQLELHGIQLANIGLQVFVVTTADVVASLTGLSWSQDAQSSCSVEHRKLALLEGESTSPGSEVAYVIDATPFC